MQLEPQAEAEVRQFLMTLRIIVSALLMGVGSFLLYVLVISPPAKPAGNGTLSFFGIVFAGGVTIAALIVPRLVVASALKGMASGKPAVTGPGAGRVASTIYGQLMGILQTKTIIGCALLEGAAFFNAFAYMMEGQLYSAILTGVLMAGIALHFPLESRVMAWLEDQTQRLETEETLKQFGS